MLPRRKFRLTFGEGSSVVMATGSSSSSHVKKEHFRSSSGSSFTSSGSKCSGCQELNDLVKLQKEKLSTLEHRVRDCVRAYKAVLKEKHLLQDTLEMCENKKRSEEDEKRFARLEGNLAELSLVCGKYETENHRNHSLIEELSRNCDELRTQLKSYEDNSQEKTGSVKVSHMKHKSTQTEIYVDMRLLEV